MSAAECEKMLRQKAEYMLAIAPFDAAAIGETVSAAMPFKTESRFVRYVADRGDCIEELAFERLHEAGQPERWRRVNLT